MKCPDCNVPMEDYSTDEETYYKCADCGKVLRQRQVDIDRCCY